MVTRSWGSLRHLDAQVRVCFPRGSGALPPNGGNRKEGQHLGDAEDLCPLTSLGAAGMGVAVPKGAAGVPVNIPALLGEGAGALLSCPGTGDRAETVGGAAPQSPASFAPGMPLQASPS